MYDAGTLLDAMLNAGMGIMADWTWVKDFGVPILTGIVGILGTVITLRSKERTDRAAQDVQRAMTAANVQASRDQAQMSFDASQAQTLTERFKALMDGYEHRIDDLTRDSKEHRDRNQVLEVQIATYRGLCGGCEKYRAFVKDNPGAFSAT